MKKINILKKIGLMLLTSCLIITSITAPIGAEDWDLDGDDDGTLEDFYNDWHDLDGDGSIDTYIDSNPSEGEYVPEYPGGDYTPVYPEPDAPGTLIGAVKLPTPTSCYIDIDGLLVCGIPEGAVLSFDNVNYFDPIYSGTYNLGSILLTSGMPVYIKLIGDGVTTLDSDPQVLYIPELHPKVQREIPDAQYNGGSNYLTGMSAYSRYSYDGMYTWNLCEEGGTVWLPGDFSPVGGNIYIQAIARNESELDSEIQILTVYKENPPVDVYTIPEINGEPGGVYNVSPMMEIRASGAIDWIKINDTGVSGLMAGNYDVRVIGHDCFMPSDYVTVTVDEVHTRVQPTPNARFTGADMMLSNLAMGMAVTYNYGANWITISDPGLTALKLSDDDLAMAMANNGIRVYMMGDPYEYIEDSEMQVIYVDKAATPSGVSAVNAKDNQNNGVINGVGPDMQYMKEGDSKWIDIGSNSVGGLSTGKYYVRRRAYDSTAASDSVSVVIGNDITPMVKETTPTAGFNAYNMTLSGIKGCKYSLDNGSSWSDVSGNDSVVIKESSLSQSFGIHVIRVGNGKTTIDSDKEVIGLGKYNPPAGITAVSATGNSANGQISGVNSSMQYAKEGGSWYDCPDGNITGLMAGKYYVRVKGSSTTLPSDSVVVVIQKVEPTKAPTPTPTPTPVPTKAPTATPTKAPTPEPTKAPAKEVTKAPEKAQSSENAKTPTAEPTKAPIKEESKADSIAETDKVKETEKDSQGDVVQGNTEKNEPQSNETQTDETGTIVSNPNVVGNIIATDNISAPYLANDASVVGWQAIEAVMSTGQTVVEMRDDTTVPAEILSVAKTNGSELILDMSSNAEWRIQGNAISDASNSVDLGIVENALSIPDDKLKNAEKKEKVRVVKTFDVKHNGKFGFEATLVMNVGSENAGKNAGLMYYNPATGSVDTINTGKVDANGRVAFTMNHASSYAIVVSDKNIKLSPKASEINGTYSYSAQKKSSTTVWLVILLIVIILCAASIIVLVVVRNSSAGKRRR